ncbi:MAG: hypothetical protein J6J12_05685 [Oscillospiraceae bacterium]|nr:hypothetical protein [Oscillospiraceae bacterium]
MNKGIFHKVQKDTRTVEYQRRHVYTRNTVSVKGMTYNIISVAPFPDANYQPEGIEDKLKYLINVGKS